MSRGDLVSIIIKSFKTEGLLTFYTGMSYPFYTVPLINAIVFGSYELFKRLVGVEDP